MDGLLTVSMIVKNEERFLPECLASVTGVADDIIVVDTGSTDRTVDIARSFGARLIEIQWPDDFSKARNVGLDAVRTPWVLVLDADEELVRDDVPVLQAAIKNPIADAYNIRIVSMMDRAEDISESYVLRLFRSHPRVRFEGKVHEQVFQSLGREQMQVDVLNLRLLHKGYLGAVVQQRDKTNRNMALMEKHLRENPHDGYMHWQMAQTLLGAGQASGAVAASKRALKYLPTAHPLWVLVQSTYAKALNINGEPKRAIRALKEGQEAYPAYTDFYYVEGLFRLQLAQWHEAQSAFMKCLEIGEATGFLMTDTGIGGYKSRFKLAQTLVRAGKSKEALAHLLVAVQHNPPFRDGWNAIFALLQGSTYQALLDTILLTVPLETVVSTISQWKNRTQDEDGLLKTATDRLQSIPKS